MVSSSFRSMQSCSGLLASFLPSSFPSSFHCICCNLVWHSLVFAFFQRDQTILAGGISPTICPSLYLFLFSSTLLLYGFGALTLVSFNIHYWVMKWRRMRRLEQVARMDCRRNAYGALLRKSQANNHLEALSKNENNIKMYLNGISCWCGLDASASGYCKSMQ